MRSRVRQGLVPGVCLGALRRPKEWLGPFQIAPNKSARKSETKGKAIGTPLRGTQNKFRSGGSRMAAATAGWGLLSH